MYTGDAMALMKIFVDHQVRLVNGGGGIGLMGVMADTILALGGQCVGVIPTGLKEKEVAHKGTKHTKHIEHHAATRRLLRNGWKLKHQCGAVGRYSLCSLCLCGQHLFFVAPLREPFF